MRLLMMSGSINNLTLLTQGIVVLFQHFLLEFLILADHLLELDFFDRLGLGLDVLAVVMLLSWWFIPIVSVAHYVALNLVLLCWISACDVQLFSWFAFFLHSLLWLLQNTLPLLVSWSLKQLLGKPAQWKVLIIRILFWLTFLMPVQRVFRIWLCSVCSCMSLNRDFVRMDVVLLVVNRVLVSLLNSLLLK